MGEPTHTLVYGWMPKRLSPRNQFTGWFVPTVSRWGRPHTFKNVEFKTEFGKSRYNNFSLDMNLTSRGWVSRLSVFNSDPRRHFCKAKNFCFRSELETYGFNPFKKEGQTLKPNSLKLGTCQGRIYFLLANQTPF